jgi:hypothetical protein
MRRPEATVLADEALVPGRNLVVPPPNRFTHELVVTSRTDSIEPDPGATPTGCSPRARRSCCSSRAPIDAASSTAEACTWR